MQRQQDSFDKFSLLEDMRVSNYTHTYIFLLLDLFQYLLGSIFTKHSPKQMNETKTVEKEKIVAEKLNGRFAMIGFIALIGAYLTTGQIIPGFV